MVCGICEPLSQHFWYVLHKWHCVAHMLMTGKGYLNLLKAELRLQHIQSRCMFRRAGMPNIDALLPPMLCE